MVKLLINMLHIGDLEEPEDQFHILFIIFTLNNDGIFEFFAKCLCLFAKMWSEMKAQSLDFDRVYIKFYSLFVEENTKFIFDLGFIRFKRLTVQDNFGCQQTKAIRPY